MDPRPVAALVAVFAWCAPDVDPGTLKGIRVLLEAGQATELVQMLGASNVRADLEGDPKALATVCSVASQNAGTLVQKKKDDARKLGPLLVEVAVAASEKSAGKADAHRAVGFAHLAFGRIEREAKAANLTPEPWTKAAAAFEKAWELDPQKGESLGEAAESCVEAADLPGADAAALQGKASEICAKALEKHPGEVGPIKSSALLDLAKARRLLAAKDRSGAEATLEKAVALLAPRMKEGSPDIDLATAFNAIVNFVKNNPRELKKPKADFVKSNLRLATPLTVDAPLSRFWAQAKQGDFLFEYTPSFEVVRTLSFDTYDWSTVYTLEDGTRVAGDGIKSIATNTYDVDLRGYKTLKSKKTPVKTRINSVLDEGFYYEMGGIDFDGDYVLQRTWFFKSKEGHKVTFRVCVFDYAEGVPMGPAVQMVLDSIRETKRK